jgi:hypothetical protein
MTPSREHNKEKVAIITGAEIATAISSWAH